MRAAVVMRRWNAIAHLDSLYSGADRFDHAHSRMIRNRWPLGVVRRQCAARDRVAHGRCFGAHYNFALLNGEQLQFLDPRSSADTQERLESSSRLRIRDLRGSLPGS